MCLKSTIYITNTQMFVQVKASSRLPLHTIKVPQQLFTQLPKNMYISYFILQ